MTAPEPEAGPEARLAPDLGPDPDPDLGPGADDHDRPLGKADFCYQTLWYLRQRHLRDRHSIKSDQRADVVFNWNVVSGASDDDSIQRSPKCDCADIR